jgi:hypothetical protein
MTNPPTFPTNLRKERLEQEGEVESTPKFISRSAPALCKGWNIEIYSLFLKKKLSRYSLQYSSIAES